MTKHVIEMKPHGDSAYIIEKLLLSNPNVVGHI